MVLIIFSGLGILLSFADAADFQCVQGTNSSAQSTTCLNGATSCYRPKFTEHIGFPIGLDYGCGTCDPDLSFECVGCNESGCNQAPELGDSFSCYNYNVAGGAITKHPTLSTCWRSKGSDITCNMPTSAADYRSTSGCGPCGQSAKQMGTCVECYSDSCNHQETLQDRSRSLRRVRRAVSSECAEKCPYS